jgi:class 3 adenylate cyclase
MPDQPDNIVPITPDARTAAEKFSAAHDRELLTILFTDLVDSTKLQSDLGNMEAARLTELHRKIVRDELAKYDAREIEWAGDSCLAVFNKPSDAVVFALRMQAEHRRVRETEPKLPTVRLGMHLGEIVVKKGDGKEDLFGLQVSEAARVMSVARGNQIFCTRAVFDNARSALKGHAIEGVGDAVWVNYGAYLLKGSDDPIELCEIGSADVAVLKAPEPSDKVSPLLPEGAMTYHPLVPSDGPAKSSRAEARPYQVAIVLLFVALISVISINWLRPPANSNAPSVRPARQMSIQLPDNAPYRNISDGMTISRDGMALVYAAPEHEDGSGAQLYVRYMNQSESKPIAGTSGGAVPAISPDGRYVGYYHFESKNLMSVPIQGGVPTTIARVSSYGGFTWGDGGIVYALTGMEEPGLYHIRPGAEKANLLVRQTKGEFLTYPEVLPAEKGVLYTVSIGGVRNDTRIDLYSPELDRPKMVIDQGAFPHYVSTGHIVYVNGGALWCAPFDIDSLDVTGPPFLVREGVGINDLNQGTGYAVSGDGVLVYVAGEFIAESDALPTWVMVWVDRDLNETVVGAEPMFYRGARLSPDGRQIAVTVAKEANESDIWTYTFDRDMLTRLTFHENSDAYPIWSPDNKQIAYASQRDGKINMYTRSVNGTGDAQRIGTSETTQIPSAWTQDGKTIIYNNVFSENDALESDIYGLSMDGNHDTSVLVKTRFIEGSADISPDGKWLVHGSGESGDAQIYVRPFPNVEDDKIQVSSDGGREPLWSRDGTEIFFRNGEKMMSAPVETDGDFSVGTPEVVFESDAYYADPQGLREYDVSLDGQRFLMLKPEVPLKDTVITEFVVVENWFEEIRQHAPQP